MSSRIVTLTADDFDARALAAGQVAVVDFWAPWCPPCRALAPSIEALAEERADVLVGKVNVDDHPAIAERYGIRSIPTVIVFRGGEVAEMSVGLVPLERLRALLGPKQEEEGAAEQATA
jgi:thioredoxin 1